MSATDTPSSSPTGTLLHLLADVSRNPDLVERFTADPQAVFQEYGIAPDKLELLRSRNTEGLVAEIGREARSLLEIAKEPPTQRNPWPIHGIKVTSSHPSKGPVKVAIAFTVKGTMFAKDATLTFQNPKVTVHATDVNVHTDPNGNSVLTGNATFQDALTYDVVVTNSPGNYGSLPSGFTATSH